jgi:polyisoprenoid-binding protein YceI
MSKALRITVVAALLGASTAYAQGAGPAGRPGRGGMMFDPKTVATVTGEVTAVHSFTGRRGTGVHADLKTADAVLDVHLGPEAFLKSKQLEVQKGDQLEVKGSKIDFRGKPALVAQTVKKDDVTITLRDDRGVPAWSRGRAP